MKLPNTNVDATARAIQSKSGKLWQMCRGMFNNNCTVPDWNGWLSKTSEEDGTVQIKSRIGFMAPILHPITEYATVHNCLSASVEVSQKVHQEYMLVTMDLAAAKIAYDIIWSAEDKFAKVLLNLGPFHTMCSYMGCIGKMMCGSGFEDIVIEAGLCASGAIERVTSGKHYNRALRVHQRMLDGLERMMLNACQENMEESVTKYNTCGRRGRLRLRQRLDSMDTLC